METTHGYFTHIGESDDLGFTRGVVYKLILQWSFVTPTIIWPTKYTYGSRYMFDQDWEPVKGLPSDTL